jgi:heme exporter protein A
LDTTGFDIHIDGLSKSFGSLQALSGIDLSVGEGEFLTIFGPNGAGKTTLLRILSSLTKPTAGRILVAGHDIRIEPQKIRESVGFISHQPFLYESLSAFENIRFFASMYGISNAEEKATEVIRKVGLENRTHDLVRTFSSGMKQRLAVARAIVHDPRILLLDEPYSGLDQHGTRIFNEMLKLLKTQKRTILMTTHNISEGFELSDRVAILSNGKFVFESLTNELEDAKFTDIYFEKVVKPI